MVTEIMKKHKNDGSNRMLVFVSEQTYMFSNKISTKRIAMGALGPRTALETITFRAGARFYGPGGLRSHFRSKAVLKNVIFYKSVPW